jgi:hypothetical protein
MLSYRDQIERKYNLTFKRHLAGSGGYLALRSSGSIAPYGWPDITEYTFIGTPSQATQAQAQADADIDALAQELTIRTVQGIARAQASAYYTRAYKVANTQTGLLSASEQPYNTEPIVLPFSFTSRLSPGDPINMNVPAGSSRTVFAEFIGQNGETQISSATITYRPVSPSNPVSAPVSPTPPPVSAPVGPSGAGAPSRAQTQAPSQSSSSQADVNNDSRVNSIDANIVKTNYGKRGAPGDVNNDGFINALDYSIVITNIQ